MTHLWSFTKLDRNLNIQPWSIFVLVSAIVFLAVLAIHGWQNSNTHQTILTRMRAADLSFAALQRGVLRSPASLLNSYDPLAESVSTLRNNLDDLERLFSQPNQAQTTLTDRLARLQRFSIEAQSAVEKFKTKNLMLNASFKKFTQAWQNIQLNSNWNDKENFVRSANVGNLMLQYYINPSDEVAGTISRLLSETIHDTSSNQIELRALIRYGQKIIAIMPEITRTMQAVQSSYFTSTSQELQDEYLSQYARESERSQLLRTFLGLLSIILFIYIMTLVYVLRRQTEKLGRRLQYETMIKDVDRVFEDHRSGTLVSHIPPIHAGIEIINGFFAGTHYELILVDSIKRNIINRFASKDLATHQSDAVLLDMASHVQLLDDDTGCVTRVSPKNDALHIALRTNGIIAVTRLGYSTSVPRICSNELNLLENSFRRLINNFDCQQRKDEHDILERRLEHAERLQAVGTLAGGIAHEFNNILGAILGYAEMAHDTARRSVSTRRYIERIIEASHRARLIIDQILAMSRKPERIIHPINITHVVERAIPLLRVTLSSSVDLNFHIEAHENVIEGNPIEIQQILLNICKNAAEALDGSGQIDIYIAQVTLVVSKALYFGEMPPGDYAILSVVDTGSGIPEGLLRHIFEPFFTTKSRAGGTGLGLATVLQHVNGLGGFIDVMSSANTGTRFDIYLPRSRKQAVELSTFFHDKRVPLGKGEIVAILETDPAVLEMYEDKVAALGYEPVGFTSLDVFMSWIKANNQPDLIMLDHASLGLHQTIDRFGKMIANTPLVVIGELERTTYEYDSASISFLEKTFSSKELAEVFRKHMT